MPKGIPLWRRPTAESWSQNGQEILDKKLKKAIKSQNLDKVYDLLQQGADPNYCFDSFEYEIQHPIEATFKKQKTAGSFYTEGQSHKAFKPKNQKLECNITLVNFAIQRYVEAINLKKEDPLKSKKLSARFNIIKMLLQFGGQFDTPYYYSKHHPNVCRPFQIAKMASDYIRSEDIHSECIISETFQCCWDARCAKTNSSRQPAMMALSNAILLHWGNQSGNEREILDNLMISQHPQLHPITCDQMAEKIYFISRPGRYYSPEMGEYYTTTETRYIFRTDSPFSHRLLSYIVKEKLSHICLGLASLDLPALIIMEIFRQLTNKLEQEMVNEEGQRRLIEIYRQSYMEFMLSKIYED